MAYKRVIHTVLFFLFFINTVAQLPEWEWVRSANSGGYEEAFDVATDPTNDDVYVAGTWSSDLSTSFPSGVNPSTDFTSTYGGDDGFVAKYSKDGTFLWAFKVGGEHNDGLSAISVDPAGNFYITGTFEHGTGYFSGTSIVTPASTLTNSNRADFFIAKYDSSGAFQWLRRSESDTDDLNGLDLSAISTSVFAVGQTSGTAAFGPLSLTVTFGNSDMFLVRYDSTGAEQWLISGGSNNQDFSNGVAADESDVYLIGDFKGTEMEFTNTSGNMISSLINSNSGIEEIFLASYDINGNFNWSRSISGIGKEKGCALTLDSDSLYITGSISNLTNFPSYTGNPVTSSIGQDVFISSHSKLNGNTGWAYSFPCSNVGDEYGLSITQKSGEDLFFTGYFKGVIIFPVATTLNSAGAEDVFVASYTSNGTFNWAKKAGSSLIDQGNGIAAGSKGAIYLVGGYSNLMNFDLITLPDDVNDNVFIAKLQLLCSDAVGGSLSAAANDICFGDGTLLRLQSYSGEIIWQKSPAGTETWSVIPGEILDTIYISPLNSSDYRAYLTAGTCRPDSSNIININIVNIPVADAGAGGEACGPDFQLLAIPSIGIGSWAFTSGPGNASLSPSAPQPNVQVMVSRSGTYEFTWTETNESCSDQDSITVIFYEPVASDAGPDQVLDFTFSTYMNARVPDVGTGVWELVRGSGQIEDYNNPVSLITGLSLGENEFTWIVKNGICEDASDNMVITVNDIITPTVITPNGDGQNDFLVFPGTGQLSGRELLIYNRWGTEVYRNKDYQNDWNGRDYKDRELIPDTYFYILKLESGRTIKSYVEIKR